MASRTGEQSLLGHELRTERRGSTAQLIYDDLRERIVSMELAPDTALSRAELADGYGVSQTPVREAILRLEQEGLVQSFPQSRTVVTRIDIEHLRQAHFLRTALELEIVRRLARLAEPDLLVQAEAILGRQQEIGTARNRQAEFAALDRQFHQALFASGNQPELHELIGQRSGHLDRVRRLHLPSAGKMAEVLVDHRQILAAIRTGDENVAADTMRAHLSGTMASINAFVAADPDYFSPAASP